MSRPVISVCVAVYNQSLMIETCLRSILDQDVDADVLVLVGDDASGDGTSDVIQRLIGEYGSRLKHYRRESNLGAFENMCDLLARAEGEFLARVDGDDFWLPGKLERQLEFLKAHSDCSAVYTNAITIDESGERVGTFNDVGDERVMLSNLLRRGNFLNNSSVLFRASNADLWMERVEQIDYQVHLSQARRGWLGHIRQPLAAYRVSTSGSMVASSNDHVRELYWRAIQSVPRGLVSDNDYAHGIADFLRRVFFRSLRVRDLSLLRVWAPRVYAASPYGALRTTVLVVANIFRMLVKVMVGPLRGSRHRHVLYRR